MISFTKSIYAHMLYWLAMRFRVHHLEDSKLYGVTEFTKWELKRGTIYKALVGKSNSIVNASSKIRLQRDRRDNSTRLLFAAIAHNPNRKDPIDPVF